MSSLPGGIMTTYPKIRREKNPLFAIAIAATIALLSALVLPAGIAANAAGDCAPGANPIVCENSKDGTDPEVWDIDGAGDPSIQGFSTDISVNVGSKIDFKIDTDAADYTIDIYRTGWYKGLGARWIDSVTPLHVPQTPQPACITDSATELYDCGTWAVSASWNVPSTAVSGVYIALLTRDDGGASHITFVVRNEASHSAVLFQTSDPTWQAYNTYGGSNFYQGAAHGRAYKISYNRPFATRGENDGRDFYFSAEYAQVRFLEKNGYDVSYFSGVDTDRRGALLTNHEVFLSVGHDEYWSTGQRANVEAARDAGLDLQFLSGNEVYWHTRYEPSADQSNTSYRTLVSYKETWANAKIDPSSTWTGTWRDPRFSSPANGGGKPENALTGTAYMANYDDLAVTVTSAQGKTRMWRNTGLAGMTGPTQALAPHTIGYESDEDIDNGFRPSGLVRLSTTVGGTPEHLQDFGNTVAAGTTTHSVTLYRAASGALVFGAGTIQWAWGLDQTHDGNGAPADLRMQQAQVNLLADMGAQPQTLAATLVAATKSTDTTAPTAAVTSPAAGSTIANGSVVNLAGTASDVGGLVAGVNVSTDNGATWHAATGTTSWTYSYVQHGKDSAQVLVRAVDDSGNYTATPKTVSYSVGGPYSVFGLESPVKVDSGDREAVQVGLRFTATSDGYISGVRFYKSVANTGVHTGALWSASGTRLASLTFANETASGWQSANFTSPVAVTAGTSYVVSYFAPNGHYSASGYHWISRGNTAPPLTVAGGFSAAPAGVYSNSASTFPTQTFGGVNYYVDAIFEVADNSPLIVVNEWPLSGSTSVPTGVTVSAKFSKDVVESSPTLTVVAAGGATVAGTTTYSAANRTVTFEPASELAPGKSYTVAVAAADGAGRPVSSGASWSFTTAHPTPPAGVCPCTLFGESTVPSMVQVADPDAVTLGVKFRPAASGEISAIKFYKNVANTGAHVATLWSNTGAVLATATFVDESTAGWQTADLSTPFAVTAGTTYVVSYRATAGSYSATPGRYVGAFTRGPLTVPAEGGLYTYGAGFPTTETSTDYAVDVEFSPIVDPVTLTETNPASGATQVLRSSSVIAQLSRAIAPGYSLAVTSGGAPIAGTTTLSSDGTVVRFTPNAPLPNNAVVEARLSGVVSTQGAALPPQTWSFTTVNDATSTVTLSRLFGTETPAVPATGESDAVEVGVSFSPSTAGSVTGIRFFKGPGNVGSHVGHLWSSTGALLATVDFANETGSGWQTAKLSAAVALNPGQTYVVSYFAPAGHYSYSPNYFATPKTSGPLTAGTANNGRFSYATGGGFPTTSWNATNYFVDVEYSVAAPTGSGGGGGPTEVPEPTPSGPTTLFGAETPNTVSSGDADPIEVGVSFTSSVAGKVTAINFYKGPGNGGAHVGHLWSEAGDQPLATVDFTAETASGWQTAQLATPVTLVPGQTYVVSYFAPQGRYSYSSGYFASDKTSGPLTAGASGNGLFKYSPTGGFPESSFGATNYFVDVSFTRTP
jgi:hypothetical protein